jgi:hypothetical protein
MHSAHTRAAAAVRSLSHSQSLSLSFVSPSNVGDDDGELILIVFFVDEISSVIVVVAVAVAAAAAGHAPLSDHHDIFLTTEKEPELVDHGLHNVLEVRPHGLEFAQIAKLVLQQGWPPADGKVLAVHAIVLAELGYSGIKNVKYSYAERHSPLKELPSVSFPDVYHLFS